MQTQTMHALPVTGLSDEDRRQILAMPERHVPLTLAADWDAMNEDYADDVLAMVPGLPDVRGREALRAFQDGCPRVISNELHIDELDGCGDVAYARLTYRFRFEGSEVEETGRGLWVLRKGSDDRWRVALDISNTDRVPAAVGEP